MVYTHIMRVSVYKDKIIDVLGKNHLMSIAQIHESLPEADYSTIFRNVEKLLVEKIIKKVNLDKEVMYELTEEGHDHFICDDCGKVESIHINQDKINLKSKNRISDITVHGICENCDKC